MLDLLREHGRPLTPRMRRSALIALCRSARWDEAEQLLPPLSPGASAADEGVDAAGGTSEAVAHRLALAQALSRAGEEERAEALRRELRASGVDVPLPEE